MSISNFLGQQREIQRIGARTPLIVPSFSSRGFPEIGQILRLLRDDLYGVCLVSAFDIARQYITFDLADITDVLIIDSGVYETNSSISGDYPHNSPVSNSIWTQEEYRLLLSKITATTNAIVVSFDQYGEIREQINFAHDNFVNASSASTDILLKPKSPGDIINISVVLDHVAELTHFDVIGITEKELGYSLVERCRALRELRMRLNAASVNTPIHVFGSITPGAVIAYFLSGADIFDGLNWLRYDYAKPGLTSISEPTLDDPLWTYSDAERYLHTWRRNLQMLQRLQRAMRRFDKNVGSLDDLRTVLPEGSVVDAAARAAIEAAAQQHSSREHEDDGK